ncbi:hypothetical protein HK100_008168 [Physocladia obscura]|uniref:Uncharacterized protein n=1 Tax=Physocladia obscura TaxID=109957 RepID=A0AAD5XJT3_9FUNG|nr:hypothetical protein HK100_008168 [Physocladia obscura]
MSERHTRVRTHPSRDFQKPNNATTKPGGAVWRSGAGTSPTVPTTQATTLTTTQTFAASVAAPSMPAVPTAKYPATSAPSVRIYPSNNKVNKL